MEFNDMNNRKQMHPQLKSEQKCKVDEAERGQNSNTRLSYPAFPPRPKVSSISPSSFPLPHLSSPQPGQPRSTWMLLVIMLGSALCASDMGLLSKAEHSAK